MDGILVVDDDPALRSLTSSALCDEGHRVRTAANGRQALEDVQREPPAVIVLDKSMPVMDGTAFVRALRALPLEQQPVIIAVSASTNVADWALEIDAFAGLAKPFDLEILIGLVRSALASTATVLTAATPSPDIPLPLTPPPDVPLSAPPEPLPVPIDEAAPEL